VKRRICSLEDLPNIGAVSAQKLKKIGIESAKDFLKRDSFEVFNELKEKIDPTLCKCALATIVGAHKGIAWYKIIKETTKEYEIRYPRECWGK
jgi:nucleotidyltransferase/DNA polymerase involved in DNA repair